MKPLQNLDLPKQTHDFQYWVTAEMKLFYFYKQGRSHHPASNRQEFLDELGFFLIPLVLALPNSDSELDWSPPLHLLTQG